MALFAKKIAAEDLSFRLGLLSEEVELLKSKHKHLELEWDELYDKVRHQMSRMSRRAKADAKFNGDEQEGETSDLPFPDTDPVSRSIMMRRARQMGGK